MDTYAQLIRDLLIEDQVAPLGKRLFQRSIDPRNISEADLRDFGAVVLDVHKQVPLRKRLTRKYPGNLKGQSLWILFGIP